MYSSLAQSFSCISLDQVQIYAKAGRQHQGAYLVHLGDGDTAVSADSGHSYHPGDRNYFAWV